MRVLVTGSSGHLGEALVRSLRSDGDDVVGLDLAASPFTDLVGSVVDRDLVGRALDGVEAVVHAATLHQPHLATHDHRQFLEVNVTGTLTLLEAAADAGVRAFVFTSTTSAFGRALTGPEGGPATWITEEVVPVPKNAYGVTKVAAEDLCELVARQRGVPCVVLRTSRFFPERPQPDPGAAFGDLNVQVNELLYRRVDLADVVEAHRRAVARAGDLGFARLVVSATSPFRPEDLGQLRTDAPSVARRYFPDYEVAYARRGWRMFPGIDRVYVNARARDVLGWSPRYDFAHALTCLAEGRDPRSDLARSVGAKGYRRAAG